MRDVENRVPHTRRLILEKPCTGAFQVNTWDTVCQKMIEGICGDCTRRDGVRGKGAMYYQSSGKLVSLVCIQCAVSLVVRSQWNDRHRCYMVAMLFMKDHWAEWSCSVFFEVGLSDLKWYLPAGKCSNQSETELENRQGVAVALVVRNGGMALILGSSSRQNDRQS